MREGRRKREIWEQGESVMGKWRGGECGFQQRVVVEEVKEEKGQVRIVGKGEEEGTGTN